MKKTLVALKILFVTQTCLSMQPAGPTLQNQTVIVPTDANASPINTPTRGSLGPVVGGIPPYTYYLRYQDPTNTIVLWNAQFLVTDRTLPLSFEYYAIDSQGQRSQPATITLEPGAKIQDQSLELLESEPG